MRPRRNWKLIIGLGLAIAVTLTAWLGLVLLAIDRGTKARTGAVGGSWTWAALATAGAVGCLIVALLILPAFLSGVRRPSAPSLGATTGSDRTNAAHPIGGRRIKR